MSEEIHARLDSFQSKLSSMKSRYSEQLKQTKVSRTAKKLAKGGGGAITDALGLGKQIGKAVAADLVDSNRQQMVETIEVQFQREIDYIMREITNFLSNVSIYYKTNPAKNSEKIIRRFKSLDGMSTCQGKMTKLSNIIASLQLNTLVYNDELEVRAKKRTATPLLSDSEPSVFKMSLVEMIRVKENESIELKSTLRWDVKERRVNKDLEHAILKTIAGFMNTRGGILLIGVEDEGTIRGIEEDLRTLSKHSNDGFELHLRQLIEASIGRVYEAYLKMRFEKHQDKEICLVYVHPSGSPVFLKSKGGIKEFPVRFGNSTKNLDVEEVAEYTRKRWSS